MGDIDELCGVIHEDSTPLVLRSHLLLSFGVRLPPSYRGKVLIDGYLGAWSEVVGP